MDIQSRMCLLASTCTIPCMQPYELHETLRKIQELIILTKEAEKRHQVEIERIHPELRESATNLLHYCEIRKLDLTPIQRSLGKLGLTRLARAEEHVLPSLRQLEYILQLFSGEETSENLDLSDLSTSHKLLKHTNRVLGQPNSHRRARIMVTMPFEASTDYLLVATMIRSGMNIARINCAHDNPEVWLQMIHTIRKASTDMHQPVKIIMDLAGPKVRTGPVHPGPDVKKIRPQKDNLGRVINPATITCHLGNITSGTNDLPIHSQLPTTQFDGFITHLTDTRNKKRKIAFNIEGEEIKAQFDETTYLTTGQKLYTENNNHTSVAEIGQLEHLEGYIPLQIGDSIVLTGKEIVGYPAKENEPAIISCTFPEAIAALKTGHVVYFDDGKIKGEVISCMEDGVIVQITQTSKPSVKLRAEKGINLPNTPLPMVGLTAKDKTDLEFVINHADGVSVSFLSTPEDVKDLINQLQKYQTDEEFSVILKIENKRAFRELRNLLLEAMRWSSLGVMIARGDLAIETGWENIGRVQKEIIKLTSAAHLPVIWATQVLDNLAKTGFPLRSEVTDAASSIRTECVMLNKGPYINKAIEFLDKLLADTEIFQQKNQALLPKMLEIK